MILQLSIISNFFRLPKNSIIIRTNLLKNLNILIIFFLVVFCSHYFSHAEDKLEKLDFHQAYEIAQEKNPDLNILKSRLESLKAGLPAIYAPDKLNFIYMNEGIKGADFAEKQWRLSQSVDFPLKTIYNARSAKESIKELEKTIEAQKRQLKADVKSAYAELAFSLEMIRLRESQFEIADSLLKITNYKIEVGYLSDIDLLKAEINYNQSENALNDAEIQLHTARYALFTLIGLDPEKQTYDISFPDTLKYEYYEILQDDVLDMINQYPEISAYNNRINSKESEILSAKSDYLPDLNLDYYFENFNDGNGYDYYGFEVGISLPVWFSFSQQPKINQKKIEKEIIKYEKNKAILNLKKEIEYAWHGYDESRKKIDRYQNKIRKNSKRLIELTFTGYRLGKIELLEFLDSQSIYLDNEIEYINLLRDYYQRVIEMEIILGKEYIFTD